jgi:hypothetical protein
VPGRRNKQPLKATEKAAIIVAVIGLAGGIITAIIANIDKWRPNQNNNQANANTTPQNPISPTPTSGSLFVKIEQVEVVPEGDKASQIFIRLSIENRGAPTAIPKYDILINHITSQSFEYSDTLETEIKGQYTVPQAGGKGETLIGPQQSLISQTREAIGTNQTVNGWLRLALPVPEKKLSQPGTRYTITFTDTTNNTHEEVYVK